MKSFSTAQIRRLFRIVNGGTPTSDPENWDGAVPWATPVDLGVVNGKSLESTGRTLTEAGLQSGSACVPKGSLIVSTRAPIGYVAEVIQRTAFNQGCRGLTPSVPLHIRYFRYQLLAMADELQSRGQGSTFTELSSDGLATAPVYVPDLVSQHAVADYLDAETSRIDALIEKKRRMVALLGESRMTIMTDGVSGRFTSSDFVVSGLPWIATRGSGWRVAKLTLVASLGSGHTPSRDHPEWWVDCTIPWVTTGEVAQMRSDRIEFITQTREKISELGLANSAAELHPKGTVVLCRTAASAGYSAIMGLDMATSQDLATWTCGPLVNNRFLLLCLRVMRQDLLGRLAMGSTHKTIYMPDIESLRVPLPPMDEQQAIVELVWAKLHAVDRAVDALQQQLSLLDEHRQALITSAVTGQLSIPGVAA